MQLLHHAITIFSVASLLLLVSSASLFAQQKDKPRDGEGISTFLLRNNRSPRKYHDDFVELNRDRLGRGQSLLMGVYYLIPPVKKDKKDNTKMDEEKKEAGNPAGTPALARSRKGNKVVEPLLGDKYATVRCTSSQLKGACIYLVSGHGGPDPGATATINGHELHEDEYAYDIVLRLARYLLAEGAEVRIIIQDAKDGIRDAAYLDNSKRETCMGDAIPLNQVARLQQRCTHVNMLYRRDRRNYSYCRALFVHVDSRGVGKQMDVFFYHAEGGALGSRLASSLRNTFEAKYGKHQPRRGFEGTVTGRGLYVLDHTVPPAAFVELGNIQNRNDLRRLLSSANRDVLARWLKDGIVKDFTKANKANNKVNTAVKLKR